MTGLDRMFLNVESASLPMDNVGIFLLDPSTSPDLHDFARVRAELVARIPSLPVFTRRPVTVPFALGSEQWAEDPDFSVDRHLDRVTVNAPGDIASLISLALDLTSDPLRRDRPLWHIWYVEGLADGACALLMRVHHAMLDGVGGMEMVMRLFDTAPLHFNDTPRPVGSAMGDRIPGPLEMMIRSIPEQFTGPVNLAARAASAVRPTVGPTIAKIGKTLGQAIAGGNTTSADPTLEPDPSAPNAATRTSRSLFNQPVNTHARSLALVSLPLDEVVRAKNQHGVTLNDVVLAVTGGAVAEYLSHRDALPLESLKVACPVNVRDEDAEAASGNHFVFMLVPVETDFENNVTGAAARVRSIAEVTGRRRPKRSGPEQPRAATSGPAKAMGLIDAIPSSTWSALGRVVSTPVLSVVPPIANYVVSNIPGPREKLYLAGAEITHLYGRTMVGAGVGLFIYCISYGRNLDFGITALGELVPDPEAIAHAMRHQLDLLLISDETERS